MHQAAEEILGGVKREVEVQYVVPVAGSMGEFLILLELSTFITQSNTLILKHIFLFYVQLKAFTIGMFMN